MKLNSEDVYEISTTGKIKAIHSNEAIITTRIGALQGRPRSGKSYTKRPWSNRSNRSNRSYKRQNSSSIGSSRPFSSKSKTGEMVKSNSVNSRRAHKGNRFSFHLSKVDQIIGQADKLRKAEPVYKKMPRKYNKLRTQENIDSNIGAYSGIVVNNTRKSRKSSFKPSL